ncbi:MAG: PEP-CTERM sorting domain-containing protein [Kiritimatiellae bacterium]|nr:PEP-CTERM sorting domain-containing protein [Kiritimatiellia bacterium]
MKKIMLAVAAIGVSAIASAASVNWASGAIQTPTSATDGTLSGDKLTTASGYNVTMYVWESLASDAVSYSSGDLFKWYQDGALSTKDPFGSETPISALSKTPTTGASATTVTVNGTVAPASDGTSVYAAVLFVLEDATTGDAKWYMENAASKASAKSVVNQSNLALKIGGTGAATSWTAVPEPTSGLLLLLGMAGLALKRKRA